VSLTLLDRYLPRFEKREYHERAVRVPADRAWAALRSVDLTRSRLVRAVFAARSILLGARREPLPSGPFVDRAVGMGWVILEERAGEALLAGAVTQPWVPDVKFRGIPAGEFASFAEPGYAKIVWGMGVRPSGAASSAMWTETRVATTDAESRRRFDRYWLAFGTGIRLIRRAALGIAASEAMR
jgi:hypothetical protein